MTKKLTRSKPIFPITNKLFYIYLYGDETKHMKDKSNPLPMDLDGTMELQQKTELISSILNLFVFFVFFIVFIYWGIY